jgi:hypothetical protein
LEGVLGIGVLVDAIVKASRESTVRSISLMMLDVRSEYRYNEETIRGMQGRGNVITSSGKHNYQHEIDHCTNENGNMVYSFNTRR